MHLTRILPAVLGALLCVPAAVDAQCTKDIECKGARVCEAGRWVDLRPASAPAVPAAARAPASAPGACPACPPCSAAPMAAGASPTVATTPRSEPSGFAFTKGYFAVAGVASLETWAHYNNEDHTAGVGGGVHLAGYAALTRYLHLGAYFAYLGEDWGLRGLGAAGRAYGFGASIKLGARLLDRLWLGPALDLGAGIDSRDGDVPTRYGLQLFPRVHLEVLAVQAGALTLSGWTSLGSMILQYLDGNGGWTANIQLLFGVSVGG